MKPIIALAFGIMALLSGAANSASEKTQLCYPKNNERAKFCQEIYFDPDALPYSLIDVDDIESGLTSMTKYGMELTGLVENPILKRIADRATEALTAAGYGPMLAIARLALNSRLNGGTQPDPIEIAVRVILDRIAESESRIIGRIDEQFRQEAIDQFNGLNTLHQIYNAADTLEKRATSGYRARLYEVDTNLDTLIEYFENTRFQGAHVKNYQIYLQLVALRLAVLAEVERLSLYEIYGKDLDPHYPEYEATLRLQYRIVLDGVFDYVNGVIAESEEWKEESDRRFGVFSLGSSYRSGQDSPKTNLGYVSYANTIRPQLYPQERSFYDGSVKVTNGRTTTYWRRGDYMELLLVSYKFSDVGYTFHLTRSTDRGSVPYNYYGASNFDAEKFSYLGSCSGNVRLGQYCSNSLWIDKTKVFANAVVGYHKGRAYEQFVDIYYRPTQEILNQWWALYHVNDDSRPMNKLDLLVSKMY